MSERAGDVLLVNAFAEEPTGDEAPRGSNLRLYGWLFNDGDDDIVCARTREP